MGVPARRQESADRPAGRRNDVQEPPVESRCLHGSQIGLAKGAVQTGGWLPRVSLPRREEEGVIRGCSWGGTAINAWGVMPAPFRTLYIEESRAHTYTRILVTTTDGHPNIPVSRVSERFTHRQVTLRSSNIIRRRHD